MTFRQKALFILGCMLAAFSQHGNQIASGVIEQTRAHAQGTCLAQAVSATSPADAVISMVRDCALGVAPAGANGAGHSRYSQSLSR